MSSSLSELSESEQCGTVLNSLEQSYVLIAPND